MQSDENNGVEFNISSSAISPVTNPVQTTIAAMIGSIVGGVLSGLLWTLFMAREDATYSLKNAAFLGLLMGVIVSWFTSSFARQKSMTVALIAIIGCGVAVGVGNYSIIYWFSRENLTSPFDPKYIEWFFSTPDIWGLEDAVWFLASAATAWTYIKVGQQQQNVQAPQATSQENNL